MSKKKDKKKGRKVREHKIKTDKNYNIKQKSVVVKTASGIELTFGQKFINFYNGLDLDGKLRYASKIVFLDTSSALKRAFLIFFFYSLIGTICENFVEIVINHWYYMPREFFRLPICPIFGIGAIILFMIFDNFLCSPNHSMWKKIIVVFVGSVIITSIIEYLSSFVLESATGTWPWKAYENMPFNLNGRICLFNSLGFGILSIISVLWLQPRFEYWLLQNVRFNKFNILFWIVFIAFWVDFYLAVRFPTGIDLSKPRASWAMIETIVKGVVLI